jgi:putative hemolysin
LLLVLFSNLVDACGWETAMSAWVLDAKSQGRAARPNQLRACYHFLQALPQESSVAIAANYCAKQGQQQAIIRRRLLTPCADCD